MSRLSNSDYEELADSYATTPPSPDELIAEQMEVWPSRLRAGRPTKGNERGGKTAATTVRLPDSLRDELAARTDATTSTSDVIRIALAEYFANHPRSA